MPFYSRLATQPLSESSSISKIHDLFEVQNIWLDKHTHKNKEFLDLCELKSC